MTDLALKAPAALTEAHQLHIVFKVGGTDYALPAAVVVQTESFTAATAVPGTTPFLAGIMPIRGRVVPVVDLRARFGMARAEPTLDSRVVVVEHGERTVALLADSAREVLKISPDALTAPPRMMGDGAAAFVRSVAQLGQRILLVLDVAKVIGEESIHGG